MTSLLHSIVNLLCIIYVFFVNKKLLKNIAFLKSLIG